MFQAKPTRRFLPVKGTNQFFAIGPKPTKKPRFRPLPMVRRQKAPQASPVPAGSVQVESPKVGMVTRMWVVIGDGKTAHKVDLQANAELSLCGRPMTAARPYAGDKFCKRCLALDQ